MYLLKLIGIITLWIVILLLWNSNAYAQGKYQTETIYSTELNVEKTIWIYLPKTYYTNPQKKYPVVYMHDGQNLFDESLATYGCWNIMQTANALNLECIIIGIAHGNEKRILELTPYKHEKYGGGNGDLYLNFIVNSVKPFIEMKFRTLTDKRNTVLMGSSLGGLISLYGGLKYQDIFGKVGVFSPSLWYSEEIYNLAEKTQIKNQKYYLMCGDKESEHMVSQMQRMTQILSQNSNDKNIFAKVVENGEHNERLWEREFGEAIQWLLK